ncbi:MAG: GNAT family N-acetyltransferase [Halobacteriales archaeon]
MPSVAHPLEFGTLDAEEIPAVVYLSRQAGWNVVEGDWRRLHANPHTTVLTGYIDEELVATASITWYGETLGWIGMVLVDDSWEGNGHGRAIFKQALEYANDAPPGAVGLDANDQSRSIYADLGFVEITPIEHRVGTLSDGSLPASAKRITRMEQDAAIAYDRQHLPIDRGALLQQLLCETTTTGVIVEDGSIEGYAIARPGREHLHLGPIVATTADALRRLLDALGTILKGAPVVTDIVPTENTIAVFDAVGIEHERTLTRMGYRESHSILTEHPIRSIAGFEWG